MSAPPVPGLCVLATDAPVAFGLAIVAAAICAAFVVGPGPRRIAVVATIVSAGLVIAASLVGAALAFAAAAGLSLAAHRTRPPARSTAAPAIALMLGRVARVRRVGTTDADVAVDGRRWRARFDGAACAIGSKVRVTRIEPDGRLRIQALGQVEAV